MLLIESRSVVGVNIDVVLILKRRMATITVLLIYNEVINCPEAIFALELLRLDSLVNLDTNLIPSIPDICNST